MSDLVSKHDAITKISQAYVDTDGGTDKSAVKINVGLTKAIHIMQDLQPAKLPNWAQRVEELIEEVKDKPYLGDPIAWALQEAWRERCAWLI